MESIFTDISKIELYSQIQKSLCDLNPIASDDEIANVINQIPENILNQKEDLMVICQLFSYYARNNLQSNKGTVIKLFEKIMNPIKTNLRDESQFFWNIFGSLFYFKLWFYEEGLINIREIIQAAQEPEIFEKEIKPKLSKPFSEKEINEFIELRKKVFKWLRESNDYHDPSYREIETNQLRLSIKTDDIDTFQKIISNSNISVESNISESLVENYLYNPREIQLIQYAIQYNAVKIFKYIVMNRPDIQIENIFGSICQRNYEITHIVEDMMKDEFNKSSLSCAVRSWNEEMVEYVMNNYTFDYFEKSDVDEKYDEVIINLLNNTFFSYNFIFFQNVFLPFLRNNPGFVNRNINELAISSFHDYSGFLTKEFFKFPGINVNYNSPLYSNFSMISVALDFRNSQIVDFLLKFPEIDIYNMNGTNFSLFINACYNFMDLKIIKMIANHPNFDVNWTIDQTPISAFYICVLNQNTYVMEYLINNFPELTINDLNSFLFSALTKSLSLSLKYLFMYIFKKNRDTNIDKLIEHFIDISFIQPIDRNESAEELRKISNEVRNELFNKEK